MKKIAVVVAGMFLSMCFFGCAGLKTLSPVGTPVSAAPGSEYQPVASTPAPAMKPGTKVNINKASYKPKAAPATTAKYPNGITVDQNGNVRKNITNVEYERQFEINGEMLPGSAVSLSADGQLIIPK